MNKYYLSTPSIVCSAGNENEVLNALYEQKRCLKNKELYGKTFLVGEVERITRSSDFPQELQMFYTRSNALLFESMLKFSTLTQRLKAQYGKNRIGVCIGSTTAGIEENYQRYLKDADSFSQYHQEFSSPAHPADFLQKFFGLGGVKFGVSTACTSGLKALIQGYRLLESDLCDCVFVGGVDSLSSISLFGFDSLGILSLKPCIPFSSYREGINIGEGACLMLMSKEPLDSSVYLESFSSNNDAFHLTKQDAQAQKAIQALNTVVGEKQVDYVNLHATGTLANEVAESLTISSVLPNTPASGIKGCIGHTLGATGAIEAGICTLLLNQHQALLPPHIYDGHYDETLPKISLITQPIRKKLEHVVSVNFAFGGDNAVAMFGREK